MSNKKKRNIKQIQRAHPREFLLFRKYHLADRFYRGHYCWIVQYLRGSIGGGFACAFKTCTWEAEAWLDKSCMLAYRGKLTDMNWSDSGLYIIFTSCQLHINSLVIVTCSLNKGCYYFDQKVLIGFSSKLFDFWPRFMISVFIGVYHWLLAIEMHNR